MPYGAAGSSDGPKSGCSLRPEVAPVAASQAALCESTGSFEMSECQTLSSGKAEQLGAPGRGVQATATPVSSTGAASNAPNRVRLPLITRLTVLTIGSGQRGPKRLAQYRPSGAATVAR